MAKDNEIRRGVSLHSFQEEYFLRKMTLEDCIAACADMGVYGIESIAEQMMPGFPELSDEFYDQWHGWMDKYAVISVCHDMFIDTKMYKHRMLTDEEMLASVIRDLKHANRLGCTIMRVLAITPPHILEMAAPYAEEYNVKMGVEIHAPFYFGHELVAEYAEMMEKVASPYLGFIPDTGIYEKHFPRVCSERFIRLGADPKIVSYVTEAYENRENMDKVATEVEKMGGKQQDFAFLGEVNLAYYEDPRNLLNYMPRIFHIHAKFFEMLDSGVEYSIPYDEVISVLSEGGFQGYLSSEYEGNQYIHDIIEVDSVEQVRRQQEMFKRLLGEV